MAQDSPARSAAHGSPRQRGQACERCWKRKQKCDRALPACTTCIEANAQCVPRKFAVEPISNGGGNLSHAAIPSYVNTLKRKRDDLDDQVRRRRVARVQVVDASTELPRTPRSGSRRTHDSHRVAPSTHDSTERTVQAAMGEIGFLSRSAMAEPRDETGGFSEELAIGRMVRAALALSGATPSQSTIDPYQHRFAGLNDTSIHLTRDLAVPFFTRFLEIRTSQLLHADLTELWADFDAYFASPDESVTFPGSLPAAKRFVIYTSVATGALLSQESGRLQGFSGNLHRKATSLLPGIMNSGNRQGILTCMLYLIIYSIHNPQGGSAWHLVGLAMKKAITFGFHNDPDCLANISSEALITRRNIFWDLYTLDRSISTIMDRPFNIEDDDITVQDPGTYLATSSHAKNVLAQQAVAHARIMSGVRDSEIKSFVFHYGNICFWKDSVRSVTSGTSPKFTQGMILQLTSRAVVEIFKSIGSTYIEPNMIHSSQNIERDILIICSNFLEHTYRESDSGEFTSGFVEAYDIFAAGVVILCMNKRMKSGSADESVINKCTALLTTVGERFSGLKIFRRVLWALSSAISDSPNTDPIIHELPGEIPKGIRQIIAEAIQ